MDLNELQITLNTEEQNLIEEINELQKKMDDVDPKKMNDNLMNAIGEKAIETITSALGISDVLESRAHHSGLEYDKEYKRYQEWEKAPKALRTEKYKVKYVPDSEFNKLLDVSRDEKYKYNCKNDRSDYTKRSKEIGGTSQGEITDKIYRESDEGVTGIYTGKFMKHGETDENKKYSWEHIQSVKETHEDAIFNYMELSIEEKRNFLNSLENLGPAHHKLNLALNDTTINNMPQWLDKPCSSDPSKTNEEYYEIDRDKWNKAIERSQIKRKEILNKKTKTYSALTTTKIAASNAVKSGAKAAVGQLLSITVVEIIDEYKKKENTSFQEKVKNISDRIKLRAKEIMQTFKDFSISSFISTILDLLLKSLFKIAKNIFKFVKAAITSLLKAVKVLFDTNIPREERLEEAIKIIGAAIVAMIGIALDELIEKAIVTTFPFMVGSAGYISPVVSGLVVGISSVLLLQVFQKHQNEIEFRKLQTKDAHNHVKLSKIHMTQAGVSDVQATEAVHFTMKIFAGTLHFAESCKNEIEESFNQMAKHKEKIKDQIEGLANGKNEIDDLLGQLNSI